MFVQIIFVSYTITNPKTDNTGGKELNVSDFSGTSICPVISEVFENCLIRRFDSFLLSSDLQMRFKKDISCSHAICSFYKIVDYYTLNGSTVSVCTLDLSKAFDKVNLSALLVKPMNRNVPVNLLILLEYRFGNSRSC